MRISRCCWELMPLDPAAAGSLYEAIPYLQSFISDSGAVAHYFSTQMATNTLICERGELAGICSLMRLDDGVDWVPRVAAAVAGDLSSVTYLNAFARGRGLNAITTLLQLQLAREHFGRPALWRAIAASNRASIRASRKLYPELTPRLVPDARRSCGFSYITAIRTPPRWPEQLPLGLSECRFTAAELRHLARS